MVFLRGKFRRTRRYTLYACLLYTSDAADEEDDRAVKRARNTMAARKSRQKKRDIEDSLREALEEMTRQRDRWRMLAVKHGAPIDLE